VFNLDVTKRGAIGPFFGFAVAGSDVSKDNTRLIHSGVDGFDYCATGLEIRKITDSDKADVSGGEKGARADNLAVTS